MLHSPSLHPLRLTAAALLVAALGACEASKRGVSESSTPTEQGESEAVSDAAATKSKKAQRQDAKETEDLRILDSPNYLVGAVVENKVQYKVPRQVLLQRFTLQFNDGTVVNNAQVRPVKGTAKEKPTYFLVGLGLRNGMFRAMAIPLSVSTDNELYLSSDAERYLLEGRGCQMCYFNFEQGAIVGTTCEDNSGGGTCDLNVIRKNTFFPPKR